MPDNQAASDTGAAEQSLGDLVALASKDVSTLVRAEIALAKAEITADAKRAGLGAGLFVGAGLIGHLVIILLSITLALGLHAAGLWDWLSFLIVSVLYILLAGLLVFIGIRRLKKLTGPKRTIETLKADFGILRHDDGADGDAEKAVSGAGKAVD
jgi:hypothetical protein